MVGEVGEEVGEVAEGDDASGVAEHSEFKPLPIGEKMEQARKTEFGVNMQNVKRKIPVMNSKGGVGNAGFFVMES